MGGKETEQAIADSRAGRASGRFATVAELLADLNADDVLAEAETAGDYPLPPEQREWVDAPAVGREVPTPYDPVESLTSAEAIAFFLEEAKATGDPAYVEHARELAARARVMHGIE